MDDDMEYEVGIAVLATGFKLVGSNANQKHLHLSRIKAEF